MIASVVAYFVALISPVVRLLGAIHDALFRAHTLASTLPPKKRLHLSTYIWFNIFITARLSAKKVLSDSIAAPRENQFVFDLH